MIIFLHFHFSTFSSLKLSCFSLGVFKYKEDIAVMLGKTTCNCFPWTSCAPWWMINWCIFTPAGTFHSSDFCSNYFFPMASVWNQNFYLISTFKHKFDVIRGYNILTTIPHFIHSCTPPGFAQYLLNDVPCNSGTYTNGYSFVDVPYVCWKMVAYQNVKREI